jgi:hypothetical protein
VHTKRQNLNTSLGGWAVNRPFYSVKKNFQKGDLFSCIRQPLAYYGGVMKTNTTQLKVQKSHAQYIRRTFAVGSTQRMEWLSKSIRIWAHYSR